MQTFFVILVNLTLCLSFISCSRLQERADLETLNYHLGADLNTLNPMLSQSSVENRVLSFIFDELLERDNETLEHFPKMAKSWQVSANKLEYTFYLRSDITWHDGKPFTADDVLFSYERLKDPKVRVAHLRNYYRDVKKLEKIDQYTIKFIYAQPYFRALDMLGSLPIVPKHLFSQGIEDRSYDFSKIPENLKPIGTGPYQFVSWTPGQSIVLKRRADYWDKDRLPAIKNIKFKIVPFAASALLSAKKGLIDYLALSAVSWKFQTKSKSFKEQFNKIKFSIPGYNYIGWNSAKPFFKDKEVRWALSHCVDQKAILEKLYFSLGEVTTGPFWPGSYAYNKTLHPIEFNLQQAKKLLQKAGWEDKNKDGVLEKDKQDFRFTLLIPSDNANSQRIANILKENLSQVGIEMQIHRLEWSVFVQKVLGREFEAVILGWSGGGFDPDPFQIWHASQIKQGHNFVGFKSTEADRLIVEARQTLDTKKRAKMLQRVHELIYLEQPYTFLISSYALVAVQKRIENIKVYKAGLDVREWLIPEGGTP